LTKFGSGKIVKKTKWKLGTKSNFNRKKLKQRKKRKSGNYDRKRKKAES
jgi:hypothetical protein